MKTTITSHPGTNGCRVMTANHTDSDGRTWPAGTAYRNLSGGQDSRRGEYQTIVIESSHYQSVLDSGFGETPTFLRG